MKAINTSLLFIFALSISTVANAAGSMLRVTCEGDNIGAEVLVNGKFRGECPIDIQVPEGSLTLLVRKKADGGRERMFEQDIRMGDGSVKKVEAHLGAAKLNAGEEAQRAENSRRLQVMPLATLQKEAATGNAVAMLKLADDYRFGENGAPKNIEIGVTWYRKAAEAGNVEAMQKLSKFLYVGIGIAADPNQSIIWRTKAAEAGNIEAMIALADMYGKGTSSAFPKNDTEALRWYRRAAEQGDTFGMSMVGTFYYNGRGVPESNEEAVAWWRKAADAGDTDVMFVLGRSYANGEGVAASEEQAIYWWRKAAAGKNPSSDAVEELKKRGLR